MSNIIDFPPRPIPVSIRLGPYVIFNVRGRKLNFPDTTPDLPLTMVLHFIPKMKHWLVDPPAHLAFPKPMVGINIPDEVDVSTNGLMFIIDRMLQLAGLSIDRDIFRMNPTITDCMLVVKTWRSLELPSEGIRGLETHVLTRLMTGPPVQVQAAQRLWECYETTSLIIHQMVYNFFRSAFNGEYDIHDGQQIDLWVMDDNDRRRVFQQVMAEYLAVAQPPNSNPAATPVRPRLRFDTSAEASSSKPEKLYQIRERNRTLTVAQGDRRLRWLTDFQEMQTNLRRMRPNAGLRSVESEDPPAPMRVTPQPGAVEQAGSKKGKNPVKPAWEISGSKKGKERAVEASTLEAGAVESDAVEPSKKEEVAGVNLRSDSGQYHSNVPFAS